MKDLKENLLKELSESVVDMDEDKAAEVSNTFIEKKFDAYEGIANGLATGMGEAGRLYEEEEYYIQELLMCSDAMYAGMDVLKPHIKRDETEERYKAEVGVVEIGRAVV